MASSNPTTTTNDDGASDATVADRETRSDATDQPENDKYRGLNGSAQEQDMKEMYFEEDFKFIMPDHLRRPQAQSRRLPPSATSEQGSSSTRETPAPAHPEVVESRPTLSGSTVRDEYVPSSNGSLKPSFAFRVAGKVDHYTGLAQNAAKQRREKDKKHGTMCGLRRKIFWIVVGVVIVIIVGLTVGLGVGLGLSRNDYDYYDYYDMYNFSNISTTPTDVYLNTTLSSVNFTDEYGHDNFAVFYQLNSKALCRSLWNSSEETWTASLVSNRTDVLKQGTSISSSIFWHNETSRDVRVYAVTTENTIMGRINAQLSNDSTIDSWVDSTISKPGVSPVIGSNSTIVSNGRESEGAFTLDAVLYQDVNGTIYLLRNDGDETAANWTSSPMAWHQYLPAVGNALALVPVYRRGENDLSLFYYTDWRGLQQMSFQDANNTIDSVDSAGQSVPVYPFYTDDAIMRRASVAVFSSGWNDTSDDLKMQVLTLDGGFEYGNYPAVDLAMCQYGEWSSAGSVTTMTDRKTPLTIAANQAGRVYGTIVQGTAVVLYEWAWEGGNSYRPIGVVNTTIV